VKPAHVPTLAERLMDHLAKVFFGVGAVGVVFLAVLTVIGVFWRYVLNNPIFGINDISSLTLIVVATCSVAYGATKQSHVSVNLITMVFGRKTTRFTDLAMRLVSLFITALAVYALWNKACGFERACITTNLSIEHRPFYFILAIGMGFYAMLLATQAVVGLMWFNGDDPNEPAD
jgi:TRAP-type C4-dicarboxylate transport system permease small subunit